MNPINAVGSRIDVTNSSRSTILIVDDQRTNIEIIALYLQDDFDLISCTEGLGALDLIREKCPDLLLLDIGLPDIDGLELGRKIKADPLTKELPIIYITGNSDADTVIDALKLGAADYLRKPIDRNELRVTVENQLKLVRLNRELKRQTEELNKEKSFSDSILNNSAHAIITTDTEGLITLLNPRAEILLGYRSDELVGKHTPELFHKKSEVEERAEAYSKEFGVTINAGFETFIAKTELGYRNSDEWIYVTKDGNERVVNLTITKLTEPGTFHTMGYLGIAEDITQEKEKDRQMKEYIKLVNKNVITSSTDLDGIITHTSDAFCEISGYSKEELIGQSHRIVRHPDTPAELFKTLWKTISSGKTWRGEIKNRAKDGSAYWVDATISPTYDSKGKKIGYTAVRQDITDKKRIEEISITDALTNIFNRRHFNELFPKIINSAKRENALVSFIIMDIDHFKQYNDTYGHQMGDEVLVKVAAAIKASLRRADDHCFRLGGEEFGVIFKADDAEHASEYANRIRRNIEQLGIEHNGNSASKVVTASMGLVCKPAGEIGTNDEMYKVADDLLYQAKKKGRNCVASEG